MPQHKGIHAFWGRPTSKHIRSRAFCREPKLQRRGSRAFWGQPYFQYAVARQALATFTSAVVSAVLPLPAALQYAVPAAPLVRWIRSAAPAAAPASLRASAASPKPPRSREALSDAADSIVPKAAASRCGFAPATPLQSLPASPLPAPSSYARPCCLPSYLIFLSEIAFSVAPCLRVLAVVYLCALCVFRVLCVNAFFAGHEARISSHQ